MFYDEMKMKTSDDLIGGESRWEFSSKNPLNRNKNTTKKKQSCYKDNTINFPITLLQIRLFIYWLYLIYMVWRK